MPCRVHRVTLMVAVSFSFITLAGCPADSADTDHAHDSPAARAKYVNALAAETHNGPLEMGVKNLSTGPWAKSEIQAINDIGCKMILGTTASAYDRPGNGGLRSNQAFLISQSECKDMHIKSNNGAIRLTSWPGLPLAIEKSALQLPESRDCPTKVPANSLCVDRNGVLWFRGSKGTTTALAKP